MTYKNSKRSIGGSFDFESMICNLFKNDLSSSPSQKGQAELDELMFEEIAKAAREGRDVVPLSNPKCLNQEELESIKVSLFHERTHYWQFISSPLLQHHFIHSLDKLRFELSRLGGNAYHICSLHTEELESKENLDLSIASFNAHFSHVDVTPHMIKEAIPISRDQLTEMLLLYLPHEGSENMVLVGYGARLGFETRDETVSIPFNGRYLVESASFISEQLFSGNKLPKVNQLTRSNLLRCLGILASFAWAAICVGK
jgi:hypothetical protein